jgi:SAM-dependent methyltransferase
VAIFNRELLKQNRNRVSDNFSNADFLHKEIGQIIIQTILDCKRNFTDILEIGAKDGFLGKQIFNLKNAKKLIQTDLAVNFKPDVVMDDEQLCFKKESFDLILSNLNLHFINKVPQNLIEIKSLLKPEGFFITSFFGEENLKELKQVFLQIEQEFYGGISPRIAPNIDIKTAGMLLQKAGFIDVVAQKYSFEVEYSNPKKLLYDLKNMGEANIINDRSRKFLTNNFLFNLTNLYQKLYCRPNNQYLATFEIIILTGWKK